ncbi:MAG: hypothetical protein MUF64_24615 [Polyangiaceae bacterium]|nr:hypothetical protein [Polyangiaceae bacterium]
MRKTFARRWLALTLLLAGGAYTQGAGAAEPWSDPDPAGPPARTAFGDFGIRPGAEYRANWLRIQPLSLNTTSRRNVEWIEHRLRLDGTVDYQDKVKIITSTDILDGTMWGDNGDLGQTPAPDRGSNVNARNPNVATPCVKYQAGDELQPGSYGYGLCSQESFRIRRAYGEVALPFGLLRVGRQPIGVGLGVQQATGDGRPNRFGFSRQGNSVDRIMFATKPLEAFKPKDKRNLSQTEGFFTVLGYDQFVSDSPHLFGDDVRQFFGALLYNAPSVGPFSDVNTTMYGVYRWDQQYTSKVNSFGFRGMARLGGFHFGTEVATNIGTTREIGQAYRVIANDPVIDQKIQQLGARAVVRYDHAPWAHGAPRDTGSDAAKAPTRDPLWTAYLEFDYASGDPDPQNRTPLSQFVFAEDTNVGLLLFKHVLQYQSARAAAAATEALRRLGATSFPAESVNTRGAFTNAIALFPQFDVRPHPRLLLRGGVLFAWADAPVNDPVASLQARDGATIDDDLVNFVGGKPGRRYGTEIDGRIQWRYLDHFIFDLEGAVLFAGNALQDRDGRAARSAMVQGRTTFHF